MILFFTETAPTLLQNGQRGFVQYFEMHSYCAVLSAEHILSTVLEALSSLYKQKNNGTFVFFALVYVLWREHLCLMCEMQIVN